MKRLIPALAAITIAATPVAQAETTEGYINFLRQVHLLTGIQRDTSIDNAGSRDAFFPIIFGGSRFELHTVKQSPLTSYLLDTEYVNTYTPTASVTIESDDPFTGTPRTRADQGFTVRVTVGGMISDPAVQEAARFISFNRHVQSYGPNGTGENLNRDQATLLEQSYIGDNGVTSFTYSINEIPGAARTKIRGEERYSLFSLPDWQVEAGHLATETIQIWPVASGTIDGVQNGETIKTRIPQVTVALRDLYPDSTTFMHVYEGPQVIGTIGQIVLGSAVVVNDSTPQNRDLTISKWDELFTSDGEWTVEVLTQTPFGTDRLTWTTVTYDRAIEINGTVTSAE